MTRVGLQSIYKMVNLVTQNLFLKKLMASHCANFNHVRIM
jgi:hypothetical protein